MRTVTMLKAPAAARFSRPTSSGITAISAVMPSAPKNPSQAASR
ncbi:Uncharacterised protein [Acinetobacter baumannii]|nr:Uncharacterised protein [Acinetobacter baumannii]